jgi:hypothetical protein
MRTVDSPRPSNGASDLTYHGGVGGIGVETAPKVYLVLWGSQWTTSDPSGEASILENFYGGVGGSLWNRTDTQYCQGATVPVGSTSCSAVSGAQAAGNPSGISATNDVWADNAGPAPSRPRQSDLAAEARCSRGSTRGQTDSSRRGKPSATSPEFWSGWVFQLVRLSGAENHLADQSAIAPSRYCTTRSHVEPHHVPLDPPISHNFLSKLNHARLGATPDEIEPGLGAFKTVVFWAQRSAL